MRGQNSGKQGGEAAGELMRGVWRVRPPPTAMGRGALCAQHCSRHPARPGN